MKKILVFAAFVLSTTAMFAQQEKGTFVVRPMVGLGLSTFGVSEALTLDNDINLYEFETKWKTGFVGGAEVGYQVNKWLQPSIGLFYTQQGSKAEENVKGSKVSKATLKMDYLTVPVLANFYVWKGLALKIGVQPAFLLSAKGQGYNFKDECENFQLQIPFGVSYEYKNFVIDARMNIPCTKTFKKKEASANARTALVDAVYDVVIPDARNNMFQFTLGYNFALN